MLAGDSEEDSVSALPEAIGSDEAGKGSPAGAAARLPRTLTRMQKLDGCRMSLRAGEIVEAVSCGVVLAVHQGPEACIALELAVICAAHQGP